MDLRQWNTLLHPATWSLICQHKKEAMLYNVFCQEDCHLTTNHKKIMAVQFGLKRESISVTHALYRKIFTGSADNLFELIRSNCPFQYFEWGDCVAETLRYRSETQDAHVEWLAETWSVRTRNLSDRFYIFCIHWNVLLFSSLVSQPTVSVFLHWLGY